MIKVENKSVERKRTLVTLFVYIVCILAIVGLCTYSATMARFSKGESAGYSNELKDFDMSYNLSYDGADTNEPNAHGIVRLNIADYASLKLSTTYRGEGKCYYRFKINESWQHKDGSNVEYLTPRSLSDYNLTSDFYDNRGYDGYIYCTTPLSGNAPNAMINTNVITSCIPGIDAPDLLDAADASTFVDISVELEAVQWNRAKELWGLSKLPWE